MLTDNIMTTERYEESLSPVRNRSKIKKQKTKKVTIDLDDVQAYKDLSASVDSLDSLDAGPPLRTARDDVLESLGYKSKKLAKPSTASNVSGPTNLCHYCGRRVYPMERIDIGKLYHKGCFRCHTCSLQLTLKTFCKVSSDRSEVYCKTHVPKLEAAYNKEALEIQAAIKAQKKASEKVLKQFEPSPNNYDPDAIEFRHARDLKQRQKVKRRKSLKTTADYQKFGVFEAQEALEKKHRKEEDELYHEMHEERKNQLQKLENNLATEKDKTVKELISWFEDQNSSEAERTAGLKKVEQYYREQREQKIKDLLDKMHYEEQEAVTRLTEKHAQEMLVMIEQKDKEVTEELGKRQSNYVKQLSYKEMERKDEDDKSATKSDAEVESVESIEDGEETEDDEDNEEEGVYEFEFDDQEKSNDEDNIGAQKELETSDIHKSRKPENYYKISVGGPQSENQNKFDTKTAEQLHKKPISKPREKYDANEEMMASERDVLHVSKLKPDKIVVNISKKANDERIKSEETPVITEEIAEKKKKTKAKELNYVQIDHEEIMHKKQKEKKPDSDHKPLKHHKNKNQNLSTDKMETQIDRPKPRDTGNKSSSTSTIKLSGKEETSDFEKQRMLKEIEVEEEEEEELETVEDRIQKVLRMNNLKITTNIDDGKNENEDKNISILSKKSEKNVWRDSNSGNKVRNDSLDQSIYSNQSKSPIKKKRPDQSRISEQRLHPAGYQDELSSTQHDRSGGDDDYSPRMSVLPSAVPPVCRKSKLYKDPEVFREFDDHAFEEAQRDPTSFTDLVRRLSYRCENDLQKVRAIFRWITAKDLNKMEFSKDLSSNSPMGLLRGIKSGTETYHNLFKRLCSYIGIHCKIINGFSKGVGYRPGSKFHNKRFRNQWTAVWIKDSWRFINCNWGARHVKQSEDPHLTYKIDEFYFLTDPEDHIQQHFPDDPSWQLLKRSFTLDDFVRMPVVKSPFFNNKLEFTSRVESILRSTDGGHVELRLHCPHLMSFAAKLQSKDNVLPDESLNHSCLVRIIDSYVVFTASLPKPGRYYWDIFVDKKLNSRSMDNACSFMLYYGQSSTSIPRVSFYPQVTFGRTPESDVYDMKITPEIDPLLKVKGELLLKLNIRNKSSIKTSLSLTFFDQNKSKEIDCSQYSMILSKTKTNLECFIKCPQKGFYILCLQAKDVSNADAPPMSLYKYLIECNLATEKLKPLPHATSRWRDCKLIEPLDGELVINSNVCFRIESGAAFQIVVSVNDNWFTLQQVNSLWQGIINTGQKAGKISVFGRFKETEEKYVPFLEYNVKEPSLTEEVHALLKYI